MRAFLLAGCLVTLTGCELLTALAPSLPSLQYKQSNLVQSPSQQMMAGYYCPKVVPDAFGIPGSAALGCTVAFGSTPTTTQMQVGFKSDYTVKNPNNFPIPVAEMLTAVTVFPQATAQNLGAACVVFCAEGDTTCTGQPGPESCKSTDKDIKDVSDFATATTDLLIANGIQLAAGQKPQFKLPEVNAESESNLSALFGFGPDPLLETLKQLAEQSVSQLASGQQITWAIPYRIEGTLWLNVGSLGKVAVGFGPVDGTFVVPAEKLVTDF
jgi:hypothetical protein